MTDPRFRTLYESLADAPEPKADGLYIAVEVGNDWIQDYISRGGEWERYGPRYYPATMD